MGCLVDAGILNPDKTLSQNAKDNFIKEVKEIVVYGSAAAPSPSLFPCGDEIPPMPGATFENFKLEDETIYGSFHRDILKNKYEKFAAALDVESTHSLLPLIADPLALAGKLGADLPVPSFPDGFIPYFTGLLIPKLSLDLFDAGIPDYLFPPALAAKLPEFISIPQPPALFPLPAALPPPIPGVTPPPLPEVTPPEFPDIPQLSDLTIPQIPTPPVELALGELLSVDTAIVTTIPKLLGGLIADIPKLVLKLTDLPSLFSDICKKVSESGIFGEEKENEKLKKIYNRVLSKKLSSCLFTAALASTIGSGKGSVSSAVSEKATNVPALPSPPPTKADVLSWQERIKQKSDQCAGLSYGGDKENYVQTLFYVEYINSTLASNNVSVYGKPVIPARLPEKGSKYQYQEDLVEAFSANLISGTNFRGNVNEMGEANQYGVEDSYGFYKYVLELGRTDSSCALFARSCLYSAGSKNEFMMSQYPPSTAIEGLRLLATIKNYEWLLPNGSNFVANVDLFHSSSLSANTDISAVISGWSLDANLQPKNQNSVLKKYAVKTKEKLACISLEMLQDIARTSGEFPSLEIGDILIMKSPASANRSFDDTHIAVVYMNNGAIKFKRREDVKGGYGLPSDIIVVEGGREDDLNRGQVNKSANNLLRQAAYDEWQKLRDSYIKSKNDDALKNKLKKFSGKQYLLDDGTVQVIAPGGLISSDETEKLLVPQPTKIDRGRFDEGYIRSGTYLEAGFYIRKTQTGAIGGDGPFRRIEMIIKTKNFLSIELLEKENPEAKDQCNLAIAMQDKNLAVLKVINGLRDKTRLGLLIPLLFPSWPRRPKK